MKIRVNNTKHNSRNAILLIDDKIIIGEDTKYTDAMSLLSSAMLHVLNKTADAHPTKEIREALYDEFNHAASHILEEFIPDKELRPDLTAEAIKDYEDKILKKI